MIFIYMYIFYLALLFDGMEFSYTILHDISSQ